MNTTLDEAGRDFRCPECDRPVFPFRYGKQRFPAVRVEIIPERVDSFVASRLAQIGTGMHQQDNGVFRVDVDRCLVWICIADWAAVDPYQSRDWAQQHHVCYVMVDQRRLRQPFTEEEWLKRLWLGDLMAGDDVFETALREVVASGLPRQVGSLSPRLFTPQAGQSSVAPMVHYCEKGPEKHVKNGNSTRIVVERFFRGSLCKSCQHTDQQNCRIAIFGFWVGKKFNW
ncbi:MAG: hypothetical protein WEB58_19890 [Planctomycetaceae bacterium]